MKNWILRFIINRWWSDIEPIHFPLNNFANSIFFATSYRIIIYIDDIIFLAFSSLLLVNLSFVILASLYFYINAFVLRFSCTYICIYSLDFVSSPEPAFSFLFFAFILHSKFLLQILKYTLAKINSYGFFWVFIFILCFFMFALLLNLYLLIEMCLWPIIWF